MRLLIDLDGVCADFYARVIEWYNRDFDDNITKEDVTRWSLDSVSFPKADKASLYEYFAVPNFWRELEPLPDCKETLKSLHDEGVDLYVVTAIPLEAPTAMYEKQHWVEEHLPFIGYENVGGIKRKTVVNGDLLLDDGPHNLEVFSGITCAMDAPYNRRCTTDYRVNSWKDFGKLIHALKMEGTLV